MCMIQLIKLINKVLIFCTIWLAFMYFKLSHLIWIPGIVFSWFINQGLIFYKDFINFHFPLSTFFILPFYIFTGWNLEIEPLLSLVIAILTLFMLYKTSKKIVSPEGMSVCLIFFSILFYYFTTSIQYNMEALLGLLLTLILFNLFPLNKPFTLKLLFLLGILIGITEFFGQIITLTLGAIIIFIIYLISTNKSSQKKLPSIIYFILGIVIPAILISLYFIKNQAFVDFFQNNIPYYFTYLKLANNAENPTMLPWDDILLFYSPLLISLIFLLRNRINLKNKKSLYILNILGISTIPTVIFSVFHPHHFLYALPILSLLAGISVELFLQNHNRSIKIITSIIFIFVIYQLAFSVFPWYIQKISENKGNIIINDSLPGDSMFTATTWIKNNTPHNTRILVAGDDLFYFKSKRLPSSKFHVILPWHYQPLNKTIPIIQANRPDYWIIGDGYLERISSPDGWNSPEISQFIYEELNKCYNLKISLPEWHIWEKKCN